MLVFKSLAEISVSFLLQPYSLLRHLSHEVENILKNNILIPYLKNLMKRGKTIRFLKVSITESLELCIQAPAIFKITRKRLT